MTFAGGSASFKEPSGDADKEDVEVFRATAGNPVKQGLPWFVAALVVVVGSVLIASWLNTTAAKVDRDTLNRGADAVESNVEEQIRVLALAGTGTQSLVGQSLEEADLNRMIEQIDISLFRTLVAVVSYPIGSDGAGPGEFMVLDLMPLNFPVPPIDASLQDVEGLLETGEAFLSAPVPTASPDRLDYVLAMPVEADSGMTLVGVIFRVDVMLASAVEGAGEGQYAAIATDPRYDDQVVAQVGQPVGDYAAVRSPSGLKDQLGLTVFPGSEFPFAQSAWIPGLVIGAGILLALLLVWMARMAKVRSEDLAERLRLAEELNESKDRFLATVSHELRTPLTVVLGVAAEIGPSWEDFDASDRQDLLTMMTDQAAEAANIVEDLLVAARSDPSQLRLAMEPTELRPHIEYALASLPRAALDRVRWSPTSQAVLADTTRLRQIIRNLLENAFKYGGADIEIEAKQRGEWVVVAISDNGHGIAEDDIQRIFEPYERTEASSTESPTGVGIGLYVSRLLAQLMGGDLECVRLDGRTVFILRLSRIDPVAATQPSAQLVAR